MQIKATYAEQLTSDGSWTLLFRTADGIEHAYTRQTFATENAALLFAAMNPKLLK
jgi:hypothetical protein